MRSMLGDATVELSLKPLRSLLETLLAQEALPSPSEATRKDQELLAQLEGPHPETSRQGFGRVAPFKASGGTRPWSSSAELLPGFTTSRNAS